jgi:DNA-binding SARP family transcriptional activator/tetratricopeptide (TPR) repeat protein
MAADRGERVPLVEAKLTMPVVSDRLLARPRLDEALARLVADHRVVGVWATAGAGKTTMVSQGAAALGSPVAWLTLDPTDAAPGRLLVYLEAAIRRVLPQMPAAASEALAAGIMHPEAAGILAQALPNRPAVLVLDELERIAGSHAALDVLSGLIRYLPPEVKVILVGRREVELDALSRIGYGAIGRLGEEQLAFDDQEAAGALELHGLRAADPRSVVEATGGWVTGVLFEAWRSRDHVGGSGGEADPLAGYLAAEILDGLRDDERDCLIRTSVFAEVDAERAALLGVENAADVLARLRRQHLPVAWRDNGATLRCHPRLREYLRSLLDRRDRAQTRDIRRRYGLALSAEGRHEEAVEELLAAGHVGDAVAPAEHALPAAIMRLDLELVQAWLDRFAAAGMLHKPVLLRAQLSVSIAREEFQRAVEAADALDALDGLSGTDPSGLEHRVLAAWGYWHVGRLHDTRRLLAEAPPGHGSDVTAYLCSLLESAAPISVPQLAGGPLDALILRISFARGRLTEVRDAPVSEWTPAATERASACRALGDLEQTRRMLADGAGRLPNLRFEATAGPELLIDLGHEELARDALLRGRRRIVSSGSFVFDVVSRLLAAKLELRMRRDCTTALTILQGIEATTRARDYAYLAEQIDMWVGLALLIADRNAEALDRLGSAVASMRAADRLLELATAAVYLSEAHWRAGDELAADASAETALEAARRQGSRHLLLKALDDFPGVLARAIDGESEVDGPWHETGRSEATWARATRQPLEPVLRLRDLGIPALLVGGEERKTRVAKSYALLAYLTHVGGSATRGELLDQLFDCRDDDSTRAYLRQAAHGLRQLLPQGVELLREADTFVLNGTASIETDTMLLQARLASASALVGASRLDATRRVVEEHAGAVYLKGVDCAWVNGRRAELDSTLADARVDTAVAALETNHFPLAASILTGVLEDDPLREQAWRLLMRAAAAQGLEDRVIETYRRCESALGTVGLRPSPSTRLLVDGLRR